MTGSSPLCLTLSWKISEEHFFLMFDVGNFPGSASQVSHFCRQLIAFVDESGGISSQGSRQRGFVRGVSSEGSRRRVHVRGGSSEGFSADLLGLLPRECSVGSRASFELNNLIFRVYSRRNCGDPRIFSIFYFYIPWGVMTQTSLAKHRLHRDYDRICWSLEQPHKVEGWLRQSWRHGTCIL